MKHNPLTPPQLRSIRTTLQLLEETLRNLDRLLSNGDFVGIFYSYKNHISTTKQKLIHNKIKKTLLYLDDLSKVLGVEAFEYSVERMIMGELSISWENLEECRPKNLKRYGELKPQAIELIDPAIDYLIGVILDISELARSDVQADRLIDEDE